MKISYAMAPSDHMSMAKLAGSVAMRLPAAAITCARYTSMCETACILSEDYQNTLLGKTLS